MHDRVTSELAWRVGVGGQDAVVPKPYPEEFREEVVRVARNRGPGVTLEQVAADGGRVDAVQEVQLSVVDGP
ncbi:hypothetical protein ABZ471_46250 [Streptomyces sp. NPDC005728]|uniref:hypothetical protein n=1 Tax=Streptomyces sp. NPDC005728 TaxID=3157054 RepID=UPI0033C8F82D